jgi:uncharacterized protein (DUF1778 family)
MATAARRKTQDEWLEARISRDQKALFQRAADLQGRTLTDFVVVSAHEAALRAIRDTVLIRLSKEQSRSFANALLRPRKSNARLVAAARRFRERTAS